MRAICSSVIICPNPPGPFAEAIGSEIELEEAVVEVVVEEETGYFWPGMRKKSDGKTVGVPLPFVPGGGCSRVGVTAAAGLAAGRFGAVTVDAMARRSCPGKFPRALPIPIPIPIPSPDG